MAAELTDLIIRDCCECDRPEKYDVDTVELRVSDLRLIIDRHLASLLPGVHYMDPPDGGDVLVSEQLSRMSEDAAAYRALATQQAAQGAELVVDEIANTLMDGVERYRFECEGGALENCVHWQALRDHANGQQVAAALIDPEGHAAACRAFRTTSPQPPTGTEKKDGQQAIHQGMTIAGDGAAMLGRLMREQRASHLGVYPDGNPNAGTEKKE